MKKIILGLGAFTSILVPAIATVSCGKSKPIEKLSNFKVAELPEMASKTRIAIPTSATTVPLDREHKAVLSAFIREEIDKEDLNANNADAFYSKNTYYPSLDNLSISQDNENYYLSYSSISLDEYNTLLDVYRMIPLINELKSLSHQNYLEIDTHNNDSIEESAKFLHNNGLFALEEQVKNGGIVKHDYDSPKATYISVINKNNGNVINQSATVPSGTIEVKRMEAISWIETSINKINEEARGSVFGSMMIESLKTISDAFSGKIAAANVVALDALIKHPSTPQHP